MAIEIKSLKEANIKSLALNTKFGDLKFEQAYPKLEEIKNWILEFTELNFEENLPNDKVRELNNHIEQYVQHLGWLKNFSISTSSNPKSEHDVFENRINSFYQSFFENFVIKYLGYLKDQASAKSLDKKALEQQQKAAVQAEKRYQELAANLEQKIESLEKQKKDIESTSGEVAAAHFGKSFENQVIEYEKTSNDWLKQRSLYLKILFWILGVNIAFYIYLFLSTKVNLLPGFTPKEFFTVEYAVIKLALISLLFYALSFSSKHYNINSDLASTNKHRKNVADTYSLFLETSQNEDAKKEIAKQGAEAMFKHAPNGYTKSSDDERSFINEIINITKQNKD